MSAASISFSMIGAATARYLGERWHLTHLPQTGLVLFANVLSFSIFWVLKLSVFNRTFKVPSSMEETNQRLQPEPVLAGAEEESDDAAAAVS